MKVAPSIVSADLTCLREVVSKLDSLGIDFYHVDVMDGNFVPNITVGPDFVRSLRSMTEKPIESHLMISRPDIYVKRFEESGSDIITVHVESQNFGEALNMLRYAKKGLAINPETPLQKLEGYLDKVDVVLVMTVHPGFSGQKFMLETLPKLKNLKDIRDSSGYSFEIAVDGGINRNTVSMVANYVDIVCAASGIFKGNIEENIALLRGY